MEIESEKFIYGWNHLKRAIFSRTIAFSLGVVQCATHVDAQSSNSSFYSDLMFHEYASCIGKNGGWNGFNCDTSGSSHGLKAPNPYDSMNNRSPNLSILLDEISEGQRGSFDKTYQELKDLLD